MLFHRALSKTLVGGAFALSLANGALAQASAPITLPEALARAEAQAPAITEAKAAVEAARGLAIQARVRPNPEASLEVENFSGSGPYQGLDIAETTLAIGQTLELGGKRRTRIAASRAEISAAETRLKIVQADLSVEVRGRFAEALASRDELALSQSALGRAQDLATVAKTLVDAGREPPLRALRAQAAAAEAEAELASAIAQDNAARAALAATLGDTELPSAVSGTFESLIEPRLPFDPAETLDVQLAQADAETARAIVARERSAGVSDVTVEVGARQFRESSDTVAVFGLSAPIPLFNRNQGNVAAARADLAGADARRVQALANAVQRLREAEGSLTAAEARVSTLEANAVPAAAEALRLARDGFEAGRFTLLDVLDAEEGFASAQSSLIAAQRDRANAAAALARATAQ
jgi:outer membrane protein, heavy metal efflux system